MNVLNNVTVEKIYANERISKKTGEAFTSYNVKVGGKSVGFGFKAPEFKEGDVISVALKQNGNFLEAIRDTLEIVSGGTVAPAQQPATQQSVSKPVAQPSAAPVQKTNWAEKDTRAGLGFAREQSIKVLAAMMQANLVTIANQAHYLAELDKLTMHFLAQADSLVNTGDIAVGTLEQGRAELADEEFDDAVHF